MHGTAGDADAEALEESGGGEFWGGQVAEALEKNGGEDGMAVGAAIGYGLIAAGGEDGA